MSSSYKDIGGPGGLLARRAAFTGNSMSAIWIPQRGLSPWGTGLLSDKDMQEYYKSCDYTERGFASLYIVRSYRTPIAWAHEGRTAYIVGDRFSPTTSRQQTLVRAWLDAHVVDTVLI
jgi:hypothetical protein